MARFCVKKDGKYLTNHGAGKVWFSPSPGIAYTFDTEAQAVRAAEEYGGRPAPLPVWNPKAKRYEGHRKNRRFGLAPESHRMAVDAAVRSGARHAFAASDELDKGANPKTCPVANRELRSALVQLGKVEAHMESITDGRRGHAGADAMADAIDKVASKIDRLCFKKGK